MRGASLVLLLGLVAGCTWTTPETAVTAPGASAERGETDEDDSPSPAVQTAAVPGDTGSLGKFR